MQVGGVLTIRARRGMSSASEHILTGPNMQTADRYKNWLEDKDLRVIAQKTGLAYQTLWEIKRGRTKRVTEATAAELDEVMNNG